jgi:hypothetical protein
MRASRRNSVLFAAGAQNAGLIETLALMGYGQAVILGII